MKTHLPSQSVGSEGGEPTGRSVAQETLARRVYATLEAEIVDGRMRPGAHLSEERLADRFGVSRAPVREAILELERLGLATRAGSRDRAVAAPDERIIRQKFEAWWIIDCGRTFMASLAATDAEHVRLRNILAGMTEAVRCGDAASYFAMKDIFRGAMRDGYQNPPLEKIGYGIDLHIRWFEALYDCEHPVSLDVVQGLAEMLVAYERRDFGDLAETTRAEMLRQRDRVLARFTARLPEDPRPAKRPPAARRSPAGR